ncbi:MAG: DUF1330 domain-containing protein [Saprospiraceae bacterium]|nr:DUF1330 domain-containing protein [Saprospiraceae bacterium]
MENKTYLDATQEAGRAFFTKGIKGPVVMLNLLKFKDVADYSASVELAPSLPISGREAYKLYINYTMPFLKKAGGELLFSGTGGHFLIGPDYEAWDLVLLVKHASASKFLEFASNEAYLKGTGHRTAALADSRLLPIVENQL